MSRFVNHTLVSNVDSLIMVLAHDVGSVLSVFTYFEPYVASFNRWF